MGANVEAAEEADGLVSSLPFFAAALDVAVSALQMSSSRMVEDRHILPSLGT